MSLLRQAMAGDVALGRDQRRDQEVVVEPSGRMVFQEFFAISAGWEVV